MIEKIIHNKIVRYVMSGGLATALTIGTTFVLTSFFNIWYLYSSAIAYGLGFIVSFLLQKFWTFSHYSREKIYKEGVTYIIIGVINLALNALLMYVMVDMFFLWYILAQIISAGIIATESFFIYRNFIFKPSQLS